MVYCEPTDFLHPMTAEIFYPIVDQGIYGNVQKQWIHDRTLACSLSTIGAALKEEITPNIQIKQEVILTGRFHSDVRISSLADNNAITNVVISNIKDRSGNQVYKETSGPRKGKATIFELFAIEPFVGPFGSVDHYRVVLKRSENQAVDI
jgi:hypothetical protein